MKKIPLVLIFVCGASFGLIRQLPLAWAAPHIMPNGLGTNIQYSGTVWNGKISGLDFIGAAQFKLNPKSVITDGLPLSFQTSSGAMQISGKASRNQILGLNFTGQLAKLPTTDGRLKELAGDVNIQIENMKFDKNCVSANGQANTNFLSLNKARWQWQGPVISGPLSCENGDLFARLSGTENGQTIKADLRIAPNGAYRADISVRTTQPEAGVILPLYGFEKKNSEFKLTEQGKWR